jgi:hypothetical protein
VVPNTAAGERPPCPRTNRAPGLPRTTARGKVRAGCTATHRRPTFHGDRRDAPPTRELRAAEEVVLSGRSLHAHGSRAARRPSALQPSLPPSVRTPRSALCCRGAAARAAHPRREAPRPPAPLPLARRGARAAAPTPLSRPPAPAPP